MLQKRDASAESFLLLQQLGSETEVEDLGLLETLCFQCCKYREKKERDRYKKLIFYWLEGKEMKMTYSKNRYASNSSTWKISQKPNTIHMRLKPLYLTEAIMVLLDFFIIIIELATRAKRYTGLLDFPSTNVWFQQLGSEWHLTRK